jgi:hypothetical protein
MVYIITSLAGVCPVSTCSLLLVCYIFWIADCFCFQASRPVSENDNRSLHSSIGARPSVPLLCFALGYDKSDMTRFTLSLTNKNK